MKKAGSFSASPKFGPLSVRCSAVLPPPYQWLSAPTVMWARASMCAPEWAVAIRYSAM